MSLTYETHAKGIRILPGQWRPHYPFEQIVWLSPPWASQDYLWLDFPEALFTDQGLLYLSHVNPKYPVLFPDLPQVGWYEIPNGLAFERKLPNGVHFGGTVSKKTFTSIELILHIKNDSPQPLSGIKLQTCAYLRAIKEFSDFTNGNKFVHVRGSGWLSLSEVIAHQEETGYYRVGWRGGPRLADKPIIATISNQTQRLVAMTWHTDTFCLIGNPNHPCMHADPHSADLACGQRVSLRGELVFVEGTLAELKG